MFPNFFCCGILVIAPDLEKVGKVGSRQPEREKQTIDIFPGTPIMFGSSGTNQVCLPFLAPLHCLFKAGQPRGGDDDDFAVVIVKNVSSSLPVSLNGKQLALKQPRSLAKGDVITLHCEDGTAYHYCFLPFSKRSVYARYDFGKKMGSGACGQVNAVKDRATQCIYATKVFPFDSDIDGTSKNALVTEYNALKAFSHERVLASRGAYREAGAIYLIVELAPHGSLASYINDSPGKRSVLDELQAAKVTKQMLSGLAYIHRQGFIHCDVKPGNTVIYSTDPWQIKICDFGFIHKRGGVYSYLVGTLPYFAPEMVNENSGPWDHRIDSYSLGITAIFMMSAKHPYRYPDEIYINYLGRRRKEPVRWDIAGTILPPNLSRDCQDFLMQLLAEEPEKRLEVQDALIHPWVLKYAE